jgi:type II secretory pathway component GspD/PulD (secretin)
VAYTVPEDGSPIALSADDRPADPPAEEKAAVTAGKEESAATTESSAPPVLIVPGDGKITVASQDQDALNQIETLLGALSRETTGLGRNFVVFSLRNADASQVAETLDRLFRSIGPDLRGSVGKVVTVPDARLNAIVVHGSRSDQAIVENLIRVLDTSERPDSLAIIRPKLIPIKNTRAAEIQRVLQDAYRSQMQMGGARRQLEIPRGVPPEVASLFRQINAASSGPILSLSVDEMTNTLIVMGPNDLVEEIAELVQQLDDAALGDNPTRTLKIMTLKKLNSQRLNQALEQLMRQRRQRRG